MEGNGTMLVYRCHYHPKADYEIVNKEVTHERIKVLVELKFKLFNSQTTRVKENRSIETSLTGGQQGR